MTVSKPWLKALQLWLPCLKFNLLRTLQLLEAEAALQSLGYKPLEAQKAVAAVKADYTESADIIRAALKSMMK